MKYVLVAKISQKRIKFTRINLSRFGAGNDLLRLGQDKSYGISLEGMFGAGGGEGVP